MKQTWGEASQATCKGESLSLCPELAKSVRFAVATKLGGSVSDRLLRLRALALVPDVGVPRGGAQSVQSLWRFSKGAGLSADPSS